MSYDADADHRQSYFECIKAKREIGIRLRLINPATDDERRQAQEGPRPIAELDCVRK